MQSITQSAVQERLVMEEELKKALDRCKELEQSSVPAVDGVDIFVRSWSRAVCRWGRYLSATNNR